MDRIAQAVLRMDDDRLVEKFVAAFTEQASDPKNALRLTGGDPDGSVVRKPGDPLPKIALRIFSMAGDTTRDQFATNTPAGMRVVRGGEKVDVELDSGDTARFVFDSCAALTDSSEYEVTYRLA